MINLDKLNSFLNLRKTEYWNFEHLEQDLKSFNRLTKDESLFFSVIIFQNYKIDDSTFDDPNKWKIKKNIYESSPLTSALMSKQWDLNNQLNHEISSLLEKKKITISHPLYYNFFDILLRKKNKQLIKTVLPEVLENVALGYIETHEMDSQISSFSDEELSDHISKRLKNKSFKKKMIELANRPTFVEKHYRVFKKPLPEALTRILNQTQDFHNRQLFFKHQGDRIKCLMAGEKGYGDERQQVGSEYFARLQQAGYATPTFVIYFDKFLNPWIHYSEELILKKSHRLINRLEEGQTSSLFQSIKMIEKAKDINWDYFVETGKKWSNDAD